MSVASWTLKGGMTGVFRSVADVRVVVWITFPATLWCRSASALVYIVQLYPM